MGLAEIADGITTTTTQQRERGVASVDHTRAPLADRLGTYADRLPCTAAQAAAVAKQHASGAGEQAVSDTVGVPPTTVAKCLHLLGFDDVMPLSERQREPVAAWLKGQRTRVDAVAAADGTERECMLAAYIMTHDSLPGAADVVVSALSPQQDAMVAKRDALAATLPGSGEAGVDGV
ncbi:MULTISPECIES: hypothetical protein [Halobacterium]|uniref:DUF7858 family protein n=1 Tax=Halobacterium TaxID=2239 RepID=UPI001962EFE4|nr:MULTISPECIES: hypothetical protein [Halobacterium]MCF2238888.1 hypothetical protein [Halobacterium salinarum]QRY22370.1 hypothetical protein JT689_10170 [Halobacterium sp. GSL-19]WOY07701.1 hypothetical protein QSJ49_13190 [Halobacterium salinarum]